MVRLLSSALLCCIGCGSDYPTADNLRGDMQSAVAAAVKALGAAPPLTTRQCSRTGSDDGGIDGDLLEVEQFGFAEPNDLDAALSTVRGQLAEAGLQEVQDKLPSPSPLLSMEPQSGSWALYVVRASPSGLAVVASAVVADGEESTC